MKIDVYYDSMKVFRKETLGRILVCQRLAPSNMKGGEKVCLKKLVAQLRIGRVSHMYNFVKKEEKWQ